MKKVDLTIITQRNLIIRYTLWFAFLKPVLPALVFLLLFSELLMGQPVVVRQTSGSATSGTTVTIAHDLSTAAGNNFLMLVGISARGVSTVGLNIGEPTDYVTYGGEPMTFLGVENSNSAALTCIFSLVSPPLVNSNVVVTFPSEITYAAIVGVITFSNVDLFNPVGPFTSSFGNNAGPVSLTLNSTSTDMLVFDVVSVDNKAITNPTDRISFWYISSPGNVKGSGSVKTGGAGSTTMSWSIAGSTRWSISGVPVNPAIIADLQITNSVNYNSPYSGQAVTFTLTASNAGPSNATNVNVSDLLPSGLTYQSHMTGTGTYNGGSGLWNLGSLNSGSSATLTISAVVVNLSGTISNTAIITGDVFDASGTNTASSSVTVCQAGGVAPLFEN